MSQDSAQKVGVITVSDTAAQVRFRYNTECFKVISKVNGASYDKEGKVWSVPLVKIPELLRSKVFARDKFTYNFDEEALRVQLGGLEQRIVAARERVSKNPFSVSEADLAVLDFDVIVELSSDARWIRHTVRKSRRAKNLLKELPYVIHSKKERGFLSSSFHIADLLKLYRDEDISFAVAEPLSNRLKGTAELRGAVQKGAGCADGKMFSNALLFPYAEYNPQKGSFILQGVSAEVRSKLRIPKGTSASIELSPWQLCEVLYRGKKERFPIQLTEDAHEALRPTIRELEFEYSQSFDRFRDELLAFLNLPQAWCLNADGIGILRLSVEQWKRWSRELSDIIKHHSAAVIHDTDAVQLRVMPLKLSEFFDEVCTVFRSKDEIIPVSRDFRRFLEVIRVRASALATQLQYQQMKDATLSLVDTTYATRLYPHQRVAVSWLLNTEYGMLGDDMGLGKTLSVLTAFNELKEKGDVDLLLVISPNSLVRNWLRESSQWFPKISTAKLPEQKKDRIQFLEALREQRIASIDLFVINFESMRLEDVWPALKELVQTRKVFLCIDESQRMKNAQSKTFGALKEFSHYAQKRVLLSGTPTPKDITDIWAQMYVLDKGERFGKSYYAWLKNIAELGTKWSEYAVKKFLPDAVEDAVSRVHEVLLRRKKEDVVNLPEKIFLFRDVELMGDQKKRFEQVRDDLRIQVTSAAGKESIKVIENLLEQYLRAVQVASNPRLVDPSWKGDPAKFTELDEIVQDIVKERGEKLVIWTNYLGNVAELTKRYEEYGAAPFSGEVSSAERQDTIARFQDASSKTKILVAVPAAGGVGITLTAAQTAVYIDRTWNAEHWLQSIDRVHRIGQGGTVRIIVLNSSKIDELIGFNLKRKAEQMERLLSGDGAIEQLLPTVQELLEALG